MSQRERERLRELKRQLCGEQNWRCALCGEPLEFEEATFDHVIARSRGGDDEWENLVVACTDCNNRKGRDSYLGHYMD